MHSDATIWTALTIHRGHVRVLQCTAMHTLQWIVLQCASPAMHGGYIVRVLVEPPREAAASRGQQREAPITSLQHSNCCSLLSVVHCLLFTVCYSLPAIHNLFRVAAASCCQ
jgi:hypothetical protein